MTGFGWLRALSLTVLIATSGLLAQSTAAPSNDNTWWKHAVIYEIYPRSFQDSNGD